MLGSSKVCATMFTNSYNSWNIAQKKMMDQCNITQAFHLDWIVYEVNYDGFLLGNKFSQNMVFCNIVLSFRNAFFVLLERKLFLIVKESQRSRICIQWESKRWTVYSNISKSAISGKKTHSKAKINILRIVSIMMQWKVYLLLHFFLILVHCSPPKSVFCLTCTISRAKWSLYLVTYTTTYLCTLFSPWFKDINFLLLCFQWFN